MRCYSAKRFSSNYEMNDKQNCLFYIVRLCEQKHGNDRLNLDDNVFF